MDLQKARGVENRCWQTGSGVAVDGFSAGKRTSEAPGLDARNNDGDYCRQMHNDSAVHEPEQQ
jgi:hypothetical protein